MKRVWIIILAIAITLSLCSCGNSEAVVLASSKIAALGQITMSSGTAIEEAEQAVNALKPSQKKKLTVLPVLESARQEYDAMVEAHNVELITAVENAIAKIDVVKESSGDTIRAARQEYDTLSGEIKARVSNYALLTSAEQEYEALRIGNVEEKIGKIKSDILKSQTEITKARKAYDNLEEEFQSKVSNYSDLVKAEETLYRLQIENAVSLISSIGTIDTSSSCKLSISKARQAFDALSDEAKKEVSNLSVLTNAEKTFKELRASNVEALISKIGTVTLSSEQAINDAADAYGELTSDEKAKVSNYTTLKDAQSKFKSIKLDSVMSKFTEEYDQFQKVSFYYSKSKPYYANTRSYILPYLGKSDNSVWLCWRIHYTGDDWIFWEDLSFSIDGNVKNRSYSYFEVERDNGSGDVWEYVNEVMSDSDISLLREIAASDETIVRFSGTYRYDLTIRDSDKAAIQDILDAYDLLR